MEHAPQHTELLCSVHLHQNSAPVLHAGTGSSRKVTNSHSQFVKDGYEDLGPDINVWFTRTLWLVSIMLYFPLYSQTNHDQTLFSTVVPCLIALSHTNVILANGVTEVKGQSGSDSKRLKWKYIGILLDALGQSSPTFSERRPTLGAGSCPRPGFTRTCPNDFHCL